MTTYNGPRQLREQKDFDRLTAELVRAQPPTKRSVIRWREDVPVPLDSIVIVFTPVAGGSLVLPRPESRDDGRTVIVAVAEGSGPLTVECPRPEEAAERKELVQPGAYTFYAIDRVYYVDTAIVGSVPAEAVAVALQADGTSVLGKFDAGTGDVAPIVAAGDNVVLARENGTVGFTQVNANMILDGAVTTVKILDDNVTFAKIEEFPGYSVLGRNDAGTANAAAITAAFDGGVLQRVVSGTVQFAYITDDNLPNTGGSNLGISYTKLANMGAAGVLGSEIGTGGIGATVPTRISPSGTNQVLLGDSVAATGVFWGKVSQDYVSIDSDALTADFLLAGTDGVASFFRVDLTGGDIELDTGALAIRQNAVKRASAHFGDFGKYLCSVTKSSDQAVTSGSGFVAITWDTENIDREGMHSTSSLTARIQIPAAGLYAIAWDVFASGAAGNVRVRRDGTTQITDDYPVADSVVDSRCIIRNLPSGYIELMYDAIGATGTLSGPSCGLTVLSLDL